MNPRYACTHNGFQDRRIRPLCHPSGTRSIAALLALHGWQPVDINSRHSGCQRRRVTALLLPLASEASTPTLVFLRRSQMQLVAVRWVIDPHSKKIPYVKVIEL